MSIMEHFSVYFLTNFSSFKSELGNTGCEIRLRNSRIASRIWQTTNQNCQFLEDFESAFLMIKYFFPSELLYFLCLLIYYVYELYISERKTTKTKLPI